MFNIKSALSKIAVFLSAVMFGVSYVNANPGDYLVYFGVNGEDRCSSCGITFNEHMQDLCFEKNKMPNGEWLTDTTQFKPWFDRFGNFCFVDLQNSIHPDAECIFDNNCKKYCRDCMIKRLKDLKDKMGFNLCEFKNRSNITHDTNCFICTNDFNRLRPASFRCVNKHGMCQECFRIYISYAGNGNRCPMCNIVINVTDNLPQIKFIKNWEV